MPAGRDTRVTIAVCGVFHAPYLAGQVHRLGTLAQLITAHPRFLVTSFEFPRMAVRPVFRAMMRSPALPSKFVDLAERLSRSDRLDLFDSVAAKKTSPRSDLVVAWSGSARRTLRAATSRGQATAVERGSTHIQVQRDILLEEYELTGIAAGPLPDTRTIESELEEYEIADRIFIPSTFVYESFVARGVPAERLAVARYGVDSRFFRPLHEPPERFIVAHAGAVSVQKGVHYLLRAFDELRLPNSELRLFGAISPEMKPFLRKYGSLISHVGPVAKVNLVRGLNDCSVMVLASVQDGQGMVVGEAMACGRPVICSDSAGAADVVEHGVSGFVFPARDVEALKGHLSSLYENREHAIEIGRRARLRAEQMTWDAYGEQVWAHYSELLALRNRR